MANHRFANANDYTADTDTTLADTGANEIVFKDLRIVNTTAGNIELDLWLAGSDDTPLAKILNGAILEPGPYELDMQAFCPEAGDKGRFNAPSGLEFLLTGVS